jgi:sugar (pentulose or hexulose) kinase
MQVVSSASLQDAPLHCPAEQMAEVLPSRVLRRPARRAHGNCLLAAVAAGLVPERTSWARVARTIEAEPSSRARYHELYAVYRSFYPATGEQAHRLAALSGGAAASEG